MTFSGLEGRGMVGEGATARGLSDPKAPRASGTPVDRARKLLSSEEGPPQRARCKVSGQACRGASTGACNGAERVW